MGKRKLVVVLSVTSLLSVVHSVHAQVATEPKTVEAPGSLAEIIVTANKRSENLQDVPISVNAVTAEKLANSGVDSLEGLRAVVPGLNVTQNDGFANVHLRGVGSSIIGPGLENPIALYVDGVYYASSSSSLVDFVDVADVQILKGPQGTLFGRNATGGLIQVTTNTPTQDFHTDANLTYGNYQTAKIGLYVSGGIIPDLAADVAVQLKRQGEGYGRNFATGRDVYQEDFDGVARSKWVYTPTDDTKVTTIFDFSRTRNSDNVLSLNPGSIATPASATYRYSNAWDTNTNVQPRIDNKSGGLSLRLDQSLNFAQLTNILAFRESATQLDFDLDFTAIPEEGAFLYEKERQFSEEFQLGSNNDSKIHWAAGVYFFDAGGQYTPPSVVTLGTADGLALTGNAKTKSIAGYGQATTEIFSQTNLTLGLRYTHEDRDLLADQFLLIGGVAVAQLAAAEKSESFARATYRLALDHRFSDTTLAYASFNTGFKSGGYNTQVPDDPSFAPETLKAYEIGVKNDLFDRKLRANVAAFYYDYQNIQAQHLELTSSGVINGPPAHLIGADIDLEAQVTEALRLGAGFEYLHARFVSAFPELPIGTPAGDVPLTTGSVDGHRLPLAPTSDLNVSADYTYPIFGGEADANVTYEHNTGFFAEADNIIRQPAYNQVNLSVRWTAPQSRYSVRLWCNNVTNTAVITSGTSQVSGTQDVEYAAPRTYGITLGFHL